MNTESRICQNCKNSFNIEPDDFSFYEKMKVPAPNVCPDCRFKMRAMWRNEMSLYSGRECGLCKKSIVSMYNPKSPYTIYCYDCFYSEKWNSKDYATEYDKTMPFFDQLKDFMVKVPKINLGISTGDGENINSEYTNMTSGCKDCYLVFNTSPAEELLYSRGVRNGRNSSDIYFGVGFENCYECINVQESANVFWGQNVAGCVDSYFILNGSGLTNCFGCVNLRNKSYCWFNEQLSSEEYSSRLKEIRGSFNKFKEEFKKFKEFSKKLPRRENNNLKTYDSVGDYLTECKNVFNSFEISKSENCRHVFFSKSIKDSLGTIGYGTNSEKLLEVVATGHSSNVIGSYWNENCNDTMYSFDLRNCNHCIGCDGLKNGQYSIFNKEYSKDEYEILKNHIINELTNIGIHGLIMPPELSPFAYNETIGQDNFPLTKEEAIKLGFRWEDDIQITKGKETLKPEQIPDHINDVESNLTKEVLVCVECDRNYKITDQELLFYKKMLLPVPRECFFCRHKNRLLRRGKIQFFIRECSNCNKEVHTNLDNDTAPILYCEKCYQQEVI